MRALTIVVVLAGCGRIGFEPPGGAGTTVDAATPGAGNGELCATARTIALGMPLTNESIAGAADDHPGMFCGNGPDLVFAFDQPVMAMRTITITADFAGAAWVSRTCPPSGAGACATFSAGQPAIAGGMYPPGRSYILIDKTAGAGTTFSVSVD